MKKIVGCSLLVASCWLLVAGFANVLAQPAGNLNIASPNGKVLLLEEALKIALDKNLQLQAAHKGASAASWGVKNAYAQFMPSVNLVSTTCGLMAARWIAPMRFIILSTIRIMQAFCLMNCGETYGQAHGGTLMAPPLA
jgi:hypothetical protein